MKKQSQDQPLSEEPAVSPDSEYLGDYPSLEAFVRAALGPLLPAELRWLLDCLELERVLLAMTAGGRDRLRLEDGRMYLDRGWAVKLGGRCSDVSGLRGGEAQAAGAGAGAAGAGAGWAAMTWGAEGSEERSTTVLATGALPAARQSLPTMSRAPRWKAK